MRYSHGHVYVFCGAELIGIESWLLQSMHIRVTLIRCMVTAL